jgi:prepilin-type N-terminal cleavage/methylation domain-containing protein
LEERRRRGFTLVEVIVVLVILAILAAIAIPALTGYIDKANERKMIAQSHDAVVACRAVLDELYAEGTLGQGGHTQTNIESNFFTNGGTETQFEQIKWWGVSSMNFFDTGSWYQYLSRAQTLISGDRGAESSNANPGFWDVAFVAPRYESDGATLTSYTILDAPAFYYSYYPEGLKSGKSFVRVDYCLDRDVDDKIIAYDPDAGYKVYHLVRP